jgi:2-polyprenyl-3-methyl-5-hydroxy-6-metoxy-1,4-benzoquinol methylase
MGQRYNSAGNKVGGEVHLSTEEVTELMADDRSIPTTCSPYAGKLPARDKVADVYTAGYLQATERHFRFATARLGLRLSPGATILDFGCGIGSSVRSLLAQGYNAFGVGARSLTGLVFVP